MPGYDRTGTRGQGPRTGGGWGYCGPDTEAAGPYGPAVLGLGRGGAPRGGGRGRGWGGGRRGGGFVPPAYAAPPYGWAAQQPAPTVEQEVQALRDQAAFMEQQLQQIRARMDELAGGKGAEE